MPYTNSSTPTDFRWKEVGPVYATFTVESGIGTIDSIAAGATFTLLDSLGNVAGGINQAVLDPTIGIQLADDNLSGTVAFGLDTSLVTPNVFYGNFFYTPNVSDLFVRFNNADLQIRVFPAVETIATFDPSTARGRLREELRDVSDFIIPGTAIGITNPIFSDYEVDAFLHQASPSLPVGASYTALSNQTLYTAAYYGWTRIAADKATLVKVKKILFIQSSTQPTYEAAVQMAQYYLAAAGAEANAQFGDAILGRDHRDVVIDAPWSYRDRPVW